MNTSECPSNPDSTSNGITRRDFMKKSALTAGAITILSQGKALAEGGQSQKYKLRSNRASDVNESVDSSVTSILGNSYMPTTLIATDPDSGEGGTIAIAYYSKLTSDPAATNNANAIAFDANPMQTTTLTFQCALPDERVPKMTATLGPTSDTNIVAGDEGSAKITIGEQNDLLDPNEQATFEAAAPAGSVGFEIKSRMTLQIISATTFGDKSSSDDEFIECRNEIKWEYYDADGEVTGVAGEWETYASGSFQKHLQVDVVSK